MSCPNRCSNDFKVKNFPHQIECVVAKKIVTNDYVVNGVPVTNLASGLSDEEVDGNFLIKSVFVPGEISNAKNVFYRPI